MPYFYEFFGLISFIIGVAGYAVYIRSILRGQTKPHIYTHLIWGIVTGIAFCAQLYDDAGPGSWAMGFSAFACLSQAALAVKYGEKNITRSDQAALATSLLAIVLWVATDNPLWSVILVSIIDAIAFYPTFRKSWNKPWEENLTAYNIASLKFGLSLIAITNFTFITTLYAITVIVLNSVFALMCLWRRQTLHRAEEIIAKDI